MVSYILCWKWAKINWQNSIICIYIWYRFHISLWITLIIPNHSTWSRANYCIECLLAWLLMFYCCDLLLCLVASVLLLPLFASFFFLFCLLLPPLPVPNTQKKKKDKQIHFFLKHLYLETTWLAYVLWLQALPFFQLGFQTQFVCHSCQTGQVEKKKKILT